MSAFESPALTAFVAQLGAERLVAQVLVRRASAGFELRHVGDRDISTSDLEAAAPEKARTVAQFTAEGAFRPLKSAPTLHRGWRIHARDAAELGLALDRLYPGALADWFAASRAELPVTSWQDFAARQSGMYRITTMLDEAGVATVIAGTCAPSRCLKRRLWPAPSVGADCVERKSIIPCLEPCALVLEAARRAVRANQEEDREREAGN